MPENLCLDLGRYVPGLLNFLSNKLSAGASTCYRESYGVGIVEWRMLSMLAVEDEISANRICQVIGLDKSVVSRSLHQLEGVGNTIFKVNAQDARRYTVSLTAKGRELHNQLFAVAIEREKRLLADLSPKEVDVLINLLGRLHREVDHVNDYRPGAVVSIEKAQRRGKTSAS